MYPVPVANYAICFLCKFIHFSFEHCFAEVMVIRFLLFRESNSGTNGTTKSIQIRNETIFSRMPSSKLIYMISDSVNGTNDLVLPNIIQVYFFVYTYFSLHSGPENLKIPGKNNL